MGNVQDLIERTPPFSGAQLKSLGEKKIDVTTMPNKEQKSDTNNGMIQYKENYKPANFERVILETSVLFFDIRQHHRYQLYW